MGNRNLSIGRDFWLQTSDLRYEAVRDLQLRTEPESFLTSAPELGRIQLSRESVSSLGPVVPLHQEQGGEYLSALGRLTALLQLTLGLLRYEYGGVRPFHRGAPSPRCLYATELYVVPADTEWLGEEGAYRYNPLLHALERRSMGSSWGVLEKAVGRSLAGAKGALVLGADFWRIARLYGDFAYNIATLEGGHVLGQVQVLASRLGFRTLLQEAFLDQVLLDLLGMDGKVQTPLAVVVLWPQGQVEVAVERASVYAEEERETIRVRSRYGQEMQQCSDLQRMMEASRTVCESELFRFRKDEGVKDSRPECVKEWPDSAERVVIGDSRLIGNHELLYSDASWVELAPSSEHGGWVPDLVEASKTRNSGNDRIGLSANGRSIPFAELSAVLRELAAFPDARELLKELGLFVAVHRVAGLPPGVYRCDLVANGLQKLPSDGDVGVLLERTSVVDGKFINFRSLPAAFYLTVDFERMLQQYGNRGYQIVQMKAGRLTQYLCLLASARGWFARPLKSYRDAETEKMLGLAMSESVLYQLVIGECETPYLEFDLGL